MSFLAASLVAASILSPKIAKEERALVVVADLTTHANPKYAWLYTFLEANGVSMAQSVLGGSYAKIYALPKEQATLQNMQEGLAAIGKEPTVKAIDLFVHLHGGPNTLWFHEGPHESQEVRGALMADDTLGKKLRMLYSTACYGASHASDLLAGGFDAANGAARVNTNGAYDYPTVMKYWRDGATYQVAQDAGNNEFWKNTFDNWARNNGFSDVDSTKTVFGIKELTIDTPAE